MEKIWKKAVWPNFMVLSRYLSGGTEENNGKTSVRITGLHAET
jgi:hypothetical protein